MALAIQRQPRQLPPWLTRIGLAGFLFFLGKGLLWLALPWIAASLLG